MEPSAQLVDLDPLDGSGASLPRTLPPALAQARDELFTDADRHGPRWQVLVARSIPGLVALAATLAAAASEPWRRIVIDTTSAEVADLVLVAPFLFAVVAFVGGVAGLARVRVEPLLGAGLVLLGGALWLVRDGHLVAATVPAAVASAFLGLAAARAVRRAVWAMPMLLAAGVSDAHSVDGGVTSQLLEDTTTSVGVVSVEPVLSIPAELVARVDLVVLHVPAATGTWMLGLVDIVALGLLLGLAHMYWLPVARTAVALAVMLAATILFGVPVPVLPMLGLAWMCVHARLVWRATRFSARRLTYLGG